MVADDVSVLVTVEVADDDTDVETVDETVEVRVLVAVATHEPHCTGQSALTARLTPPSFNVWPHEPAAREAHVAGSSRSLHLPGVVPVVVGVVV